MLRIALPNKGRLADQALTLFEKAGLKAEARADRALVANLGSQFQAIFVRAQDIPEFVADGAAELGVTGADLVAETGQPIRELLDLEFGRCRLAVAFFRSLGLEVRVAPVSGAAEIAPHLGVAEVIVDLVSTGSTLRVNGLREVGTILESSARLVANPAAVDHEIKGPVIAELVTALESVTRARSKRYLMANVPRDRLEEVKQIIPGLSGPTIVEIQNGDGRWVAAHAVVDAHEIYKSITRLKALGAEGILVTPIERLMP